MQPIPIRPTPAMFHRYRAKELSRTLPTTLYKILSPAYARRLLHRGEMMWSTLSWFQNEEDDYRRDRSEGSRRYFPAKGLDVNRLERNGKPDDSSFMMSSHGTVSRAAQSNHIFVYSMTVDGTVAIGDPSDRACIEIFDPALFIQRVRDSLKQHRKARPETFIHDKVQYWNSENPPGNVWPLPHLLTMHKHENHAWQREYRLAFGIRANVFDFENVECFIVERHYQWPRVVLDPSRHRRKVLLGPLVDCCRLVEREAQTFTSAQCVPRQLH